MASQHWINLGPDGTFKPTGDLTSTPEDVERLLGTAMDGSDRLVLYFHGGLVKESAGLESAERMARNYGSSASSIGIIWETGLGETVRDNLAEITQTKLFKKALSWVLAKAGFGEEAGARGFIGTSLSRDEIERHLQTSEGTEELQTLLDAQVSVDENADGAKSTTLDDLEVEALALEIELDLSSDPSFVELMEGAEADEPLARHVSRESGAKGLSFATVALFIAKVVLAVIGRYRTGTHHGAIPTAVEELLRAAYLAEVGKFVWDAMKTKASRMWIDDGPSPTLESHAGGYILRCLEQLQQTRPEVRIDLVGHSAGAIAICEMLRAIEEDKRNVRLGDVVFLAPAARLDLFARWIPRGPKIFDRFRMFTMTDKYEKKDRIGGPIYPRSLLYIVSGCFEDRPDTALVGMDRFLQEAMTSAGTDYDNVRAWLRSSHRLVHSPSSNSAGSGLQTKAIKHGDFDNDPPTLASLLHMVGESS